MDPELIIPNLDLNFQDDLKYIEDWKLRILGIPRELLCERKDPMTQKPTTPGEILQEEFLKPLGISATEFAEHIKCSELLVTLIINGNIPVTCHTALMLSRALDTTPEFWLAAQLAVDFEGYKDKLPGSIRKKDRT